MTVKPGWARKRGRLRRREADAARAGAAPPEPDAAAPKAEEPSWALSAADWRLLIITFVGGVGSIVASAGIIGGAIAIGRAAGGDPGYWFLYTVGSAVLFVVTVRFYKPLLGGVGNVSGRLRFIFLVGGVIAWGFVVATGLLVVLSLLVLIGRAAGIK